MENKYATIPPGIWRATLELIPSKPVIGNDGELYQELKNVPAYGVSVTAEEPGYGRDNPFTPYKELPSEIVEEVQDDAAVNEAITEAQAS